MHPIEALAALDRLEDTDNPYRVVISVGMLKEGWDVKNVYVIASMRASVSEILTEQTLGRGLRLPFGQYTGVEFLDTLEVLGHERYEELLRKAGVLTEQFVDWRTAVVLKPDSQGRLMPVTETEKVQAPVELGDGSLPPAASPQGEAPAPAAPAIRSVEEHTEEAEEQVAALSLELAPRADRRLRIPLLRMTEVRSQFSLADITELEPFRRLGESLAADPAGSLRRVTVSAQIITGSDGLRRTELVTAPALDRVESPALLFRLADLREQLVAQILGASVVPARANQRGPAANIVDAMIHGLGTSAATILSGYMNRAAAGLIQLITDEHRKFAAKPSFQDVLELVEFSKVRTARPETSLDRFGAFRKSVGYECYTKSLYAQDWFDSSTERDVANVLETDDTIALWVRLQTGDLPILWSGAREYNPDFIAIDADDVHSLIEVKMDKEMTSADVQGKREAARRWANHVSADEKVGTRWRYLLLSETDVRTAKGSWDALKRLGGAPS